MTYTLHHGDCLDVLKTLPDNSVDSIVTDPPYGLSFMGRKWDYDVPSVEVWAECLRVLKPGGHLLAFAGTRTQHRMAVRIEDAGFEIRDMLAWVYGSGFPKSLDVSKAIDKAAGAERDVVGLKRYGDGQTYRGGEAAARTGGGIMGEAAARGPSLETDPATEAARQWQGWGTALKPALEPITMARKPFAGTVAANVLVHGTGALNIDGCRVDFSSKADEATSKAKNQHADFDSGPRLGNNVYGTDLSNRPNYNPPGRWPANLLHDGGEPADLLGSAARFFYCAKASKKDRDFGLGNLPLKEAGVGDERASGSFNERLGKTTVAPRANHHPTVKPTDLMRYLLRLVTPPGGVALDPFMGSGSTGKAAVLEGFGFIGIEREAEYLAIARARIDHAATPLFT